ncbi:MULTISPECIES: hypothetical protein [Cohaesibacter]|uniref:hypothetical protein n=1 Tax=Cohaesibacter TaxID=655352 RepID=UPI0010FD9047|nr:MULTISPECIES: hypothetical protein [Cohaesibacter]TLP42906.1 hypothetical protein FDK21_18955 [Cohaesibacter sp. CAU 1516]
MVKLKFRMLATMLALSVTISGCIATKQPNEHLTPTEIALRQKQTEHKRVVQGVATGALIGAAVGGGLGLILSGGDKRSMLRGAGLGALAGGVMGGVDASKVNKETREVSAEQDELKSIIAATEKSIAYYRSMANMTAKLTANANQRIPQMNASYQAGTLDRDTYRNQMLSARENMRIINDQVDNVDRDISDLEAVKKNKKLKVDAQIAKLKAQKAALTKQRDALQTAYSRVPDDLDLAFN